jgi:hypothetical protein
MCRRIRVVLCERQHYDVGRVKVFHFEHERSIVPISLPAREFANLNFWTFEPELVIWFSFSLTRRNIRQKFLHYYDCSLSAMLQWLWVAFVHGQSNHHDTQITTHWRNAPSET